MIDIAINGATSDVVKLIVILTLIAVAPFMLLMMTCFARIIIVFSFMRNALGLQQTPPNQVLIGLALFITFFIMAPVVGQINETAFQPYNEGQIETQEFLDRASIPLKEFMLKQTTAAEVELYKGLSTTPNVENLQPHELPMSIVVPAFITSELGRLYRVPAVHTVSDHRYGFGQHPNVTGIIMLPLIRRLKSCCLWWWTDGGS